MEIVVMHLYLFIPVTNNDNCSNGNSGNALIIVCSWDMQ